MNQGVNLLVRLFLIFFILITSSVLLKAQILDDSSKLVYGPKTISFIYESNMLNNDSIQHAIDTSIYQFERKSLVQRSGHRYQDLGNFGSAVFPVFYDAKWSTGQSSGFNSFRPFAITPETIKYYDTKSPYIEVLGYLGGANKNLVNVEFTRNISKNWNFGFQWKGITSDKMLSRRGQGDRNIVSTAFKLYTHYKSKKAPYEFLATYTQTKHNASETGGTRYSQDSLVSDLLEHSNVLTKLRNAKSQFKLVYRHLYQQYKLVNQFQVYHKFDWEIESNSYRDHDDGQLVSGYNAFKDYYNRIIARNDSTQDGTSFEAITNEGGIKGDISSVFYRAYFKWRYVNYQYYKNLEPRYTPNETYLGLYARFKWKEKLKVIAQGEVMQQGAYELNASIESKFLNLKYRSQKSLVPFLYYDYFGNHDEWLNNLNSVFTNELSGTGNFKISKLTLKPEGSFITYGNYLYFDQNGKPTQITTPVLITRLGGQINLSFPNEKGESINLENEFLFTQVAGGKANVIRIPKGFYNGRYYWDGKVFKDKVPIQLGVATHARTGYYANGYIPYIQQFHLQDELKTDAYFKVDLFLNMRLDKFFFVFKWSHLYQRSNHSQFPNLGYFATPYYPGLPNTIDLGVKWLFFD